MFFSGLVLRIKIKKRWTSLTDYVDFCSILHGLQIAEYSFKDCTYADACLDRVICEAYRLELKGESIRN